MDAAFSSAALPPLRRGNLPQSRKGQRNARAAAPARARSGRVRRLFAADTAPGDSYLARRCAPGFWRRAALASGCPAACTATGGITPRARPSAAARGLLSKRIQQMAGIKSAQEGADGIIDLFAARADIVADSALSFVQRPLDAGGTSCSGAAS